MFLSFIKIELNKIMDSKIFKIKGMHCASCASIIEKTLKKIDGVNLVEVNSGTENMKISFDESKTNVQDLSGKIEPLGYFIVDSTASSKKDKLDELKVQKMKVISSIPLAVISLFVMAWDILMRFKLVMSLPFALDQFLHYLLPVMAVYMLFVVGKPYLSGVYRFLKYGKANMDTLIGIGTGVAFLYSFIVTLFTKSLGQYINTTNTYFDVVIIVITFISLGKYLETRSKLKTGDAIEKLLNLQAKTAFVFRDGVEKDTAESIKNIFLQRITGNNSTNSNSTNSTNENILLSRLPISSFSFFFSFF